MAFCQPRYSKEEFAQRGDLIYQTQIRPQVEANNQGKIVAIDLETGDFEVDAREISACNRLEARHPDSQIWIVRVGSRHVRRFYEAVVVWDGDYLTIPIDEADSESLVGMSLMEGYQLTVQVFEEGSVEIRKVSAV
jgi:hypothetical protein